MPPAKLDPIVIRRILQKVVIYLSAAVAYYALARFLVDLPDGAPASGLLRGAGRPQGWRFFFGALAPVAWLLLTLCGEVICAWWQRKAPDSPYRKETAAAYLRYEFRSLAALALMGLGLVAHSWLGDFHTILGLLYLLILAGKTALVAWLLTRVSQDPALAPQVSGGPETLLATGLGLLCTLFFGGLAFWTMQALSATPAEAAALLRAHGLLERIGLLGPAPADAATSLGFMWGVWPQLPAGASPGSSLFAWLLAPGYLLAGRLGALLTMAILGGACVGGFFALCRRLDYARSRSFLAAWFLALSPPFLIHIQQLFPQMLGAAWAVWAMLVLLSMAQRPWPALFWLVFLAAALVLIQPALFPLALALFLAGLFRFLWLVGGGRLVKWGLVLVLLVLALMLLGFPGSRALDALIIRVAAPFGQIPGSGLAALGAAAALIFDQQFGLLAFMPWLLFCLAGALLFMRARPLAGLAGLWVCACFFLALALWRWTSWPDGASPPGRLLVPIIPLMALWALPALAPGLSRLWRGLATAAFGLGLLISLALTLLPMLRFQPLSGLNNLLLNLGALSGAPLGRFFPGFLNYYGPDMLKALPWAALILILFTWLAVRPERAQASPGTWLRWREACFTLLIAFLALIAAGRLVPGGSLQAEAMTSGGATIQSAGYPGPVYLSFSRPGTWASGRFIWGSGQNYLTLAARCLPGPASAQAAPFAALQMIIDGRLIRELRITPNHTRYRTRLRLEAGRHSLELVLSGQQGGAALLLDRVDFD